MHTIYDVVVHFIRAQLKAADEATDRQAKRAYIQRARGAWLLQPDFVKAGLLPEDDVDVEEYWGLDRQIFKADHALDAGALHGTD